MGGDVKVVTLIKRSNYCSKALVIITMMELRVGGVDGRLPLGSY